MAARSFPHCARAQEVSIPPQYKDLNDWTRAGANGTNLVDAIRNAEVIRTSPCVHEGATVPDPLEGKSVPAALEFEHINGKPALVLPGSSVEFQECAAKCFPVLAKSHRYFIRGGTPFELIQFSGTTRLVELD